MFLRLLALFTLVPLVELYLLVAIGQQMGLVPTLALVLSTGALGAALARSQGLKVLRQVQAETARGVLPAEALLDGLMIFLAGAVLLTPGLLTDLTGFFLLIPAGRRWVRQAVRRRLGQRFPAVHMTGGPRAPTGGPWPPHSQSSQSRTTQSQTTQARATPQQVIVVDHRKVEEPPADADKQLSD